MCARAARLPYPGWTGPTVRFVLRRGPPNFATGAPPPPPAIDGIRAPYLMGGVVKEMIYGLKYRNMRASAPELGRLLTAYMESDPIAADVLMPVALHKRGQRERG